MSSVRISEIYWYLLFERGLSSMGMGGEFKYGVPEST